MSEAIELPEWLTQEYLMHRYEYDPEHGYLRFPKGHPTRAGKVAGAYTNKGHFIIKIKGRRYSLRKIIYLMLTGVYPERVINTNKTDKLSTRIEDLAVYEWQEA